MKILCITLLCLLAWTAPSFGWLDLVQLDSFRPAAGDSITITVKGTMPNSCWRVVDQKCGGAGGHEINIEITTYDFGLRPLEHCLMVLVPYELSCTYRLPTAGTYTVTVTEICDSLSPCNGGTITGTFDTRGPGNPGPGWSTESDIHR